MPNVRYPRRYRLWTTGGPCSLEATPSLLNGVIDTLGYHNELAGAFYAPTDHSCAICDGPNGRPIIAVQEWHDTGDPDAVNLTHGPFVYEWDGASWNLLADASFDGGLGTHQTPGDLMQESVPLSLNPVLYDWTAPEGTYTGRRFDPLSDPPPMQSVASDGVRIYADWGHSLATGDGNNMLAQLNFWRVKAWDGSSWTELGGANTTAPANTTDSSNGSLHYGNKLLASAEDVGHPYMLFVDRWAAADFNALYCWRWDGADWIDLPGLSMPPAGYVSLSATQADYALGVDANPTVVCVDSSELVFQTWNGASWDSVTSDLATLTGTTLDVGAAKVSIAPLDPTMGMHLVAVQVYTDPGGPGLYVIEYYPDTQTLQPAFNDSAKSFVGAAGTGFFPKALGPSLGTYWVMNEHTVYRYDNRLCDNGWEAAGGTLTPIPGRPLSRPAKAYIKGSFIYEGTLYTDDPGGSNLWRGHVVDSYLITCDPCTPAPVEGDKYINVTFRIDGTEYDTSDITADNVTELTVINVGARYGIDVNKHEIDDVRVGTTGYGSSDVFSADFTGGTVVPPFDSTVNGGDLDASGGTLAIDNAGADAYAVKDVSLTAQHAYFQFKVKVSQDWIDSGQASADFFEVESNLGGPYDGVWLRADPFLTWLIYTTGTDYDGPISADTWYTVDFFFEWGFG